MLTKIIPSYLYLQYKGDTDLQTFVDTYNEMAQEYMDWFTSINLPDYTGPMVEGDLLDWVAQGLYGIKRPALISNTLVSDDVYKRVISWHFFKADGKQFNVRWLKRRIMRFLVGQSGKGLGINQTYQISVRFVGNGDVLINVLTGIAYQTGKGQFNRSQFNTRQFNDMQLILQNFADTTLAPELKAGIESGVLELPFQPNFIVGINP